MRSLPLPLVSTVLAVLAVLATACASPSPGAAKHDDASRPAAAPPPASPPAATATAPSAPLPSPEPTPPAPPLLGRDHRSAVACSSDADCGWDDDCAPTRCVEDHPPQACDESTPPPGTCACVAGSCTLRPKRPPPPTAACEPRACMVDRAAGTCVADDGGVPENVRTTPPVEVGPSCDCIDPARGCTYTWFDPVPCTTDRDCWVDPAPRRHPVARPKALRKRDFRPCADGEVAPKCGPAGQCVLGPAYSC